LTSKKVAVVAGIAKGGAAARAAWNLIDPDALERIPISLLPDDVGNDVIRVLMLIARSVIRAIASSTQMSYVELRARLWQQLALVLEDNPASECVRVLLTAWDDTELAQFVTADMLSIADPADIAFEFAFLLRVVASTFTASVGEPLPRYYEKIRAWLGV
jgi:hypothetical protein